jgi:putative membrane-bound dehydrogenase-like protein
MMLRCCLSLLICLLALPLLAQQRPLPPDLAAESMKLPPGFSATLFAGEPAIVQPMAFTFDDRGRVWVVECLSYPTWKADGTGNDRVTILEDTDGDGRHDKRTVFLDNGSNLSGIEVGFGGVWLTSAPNFIFIPDADGDDKPDGPPKILLEGWTLDAKHNVVGNLAWGPDGWLYGCNGITAPSFVGKPGTPPDQRQKVSCGVWRYHPVQHEWEVYANGTTNPWGIDWDERGQMFITNCVIKHIFHVVPGAHFVRMFGQDPNPNVYGLLESCADHQHWAGGHWTTARGGSDHHDAGGGHAHSGCMIYLGDNWPAEYRSNAFLLNIHGQRLNRDVLERSGSGFVAKHAPDMIFSHDPWFRGLHAKYGPDGGVYISDWSDTGECHDAKETDCDKSGGRIFKVVYDKKPAANAVGKGAVGNALRAVPQPLDLQKITDAELAALQFHRNEWFVRHSRRLLQERAAAGKLDADALVQAGINVRGLESDTHNLRSLFTLHVTGKLDRDTWLTAAASRDGIQRAQAAILAVERRDFDRTALGILKSLAGPSERSPFVRLHVASALQRVPLADRWPIAEALLAHADDASDAYLPLMIWYAVEPLVPHDVNRAIELLPQAKIPLVRQYLARRILAHHEEQNKAQPGSSTAVDAIVALVAKSDDAVLQADILRGLAEAFAGRTSVPMPPGWETAYRRLSASLDARITESALELAVLFGDAAVLKKLKDPLYEQKGVSSEVMHRSLTLLHLRRDPGTPRYAMNFAAVWTGPLREDSIRILAAYDDPRIPERLLSIYPRITPAERADLIQTLTARPAFALALLGAIEAGKIPRQDVSALVIRQLLALDNQEVSDRLKQVWGDIRPPSAEKKERIAQLKVQLTAEALSSADLARGRTVYAKTCAACHKLFDDGGKLAPELTGSQRHNLDYVLDNVLDPSAIVPREYKANILRLADGRVVQGVIVEETPHAVAVQTPSELVRVPVGDIEARKESSLSMMPEGLFDRLQPDEIRDLVAYLAAREQVPLPRGFTR